MESAPANQLEFRRAPLDNLGRLVRLMEAAFGSAPDPEYFDWKYVQNPHGQMVGFEALDGSTPVAFYCVIPQIYSDRRRSGTGFSVSRHDDRLRRTKVVDCSFS